MKLQKELKKLNRRNYETSESVNLTDEIAKQDIENKAKNIKSSDEAVEVANVMEKVIRSNECCILWLAYQQGKIFEKFKANDKLINLVNNFKINRSAMPFKISIVKFRNKYPKMKKSSLSLHYFLKNNFKIIKEICHENASEFE